MPQLDNAIFFFESIGFVMSFFSLIFYNQYIFYPNMLKSLYARRFLLQNSIKQINTCYSQLFILIDFIKKFDFFFLITKIESMQLFFKKLVKIYLKKISLYLYFLEKGVNNQLNLFLNKLNWIIFFLYEFKDNYNIEI